MRHFISGEGTIELQIEFADADEGYHQGQCDQDILALSKKPYIAEQLEKIDPAKLRDELRRYGAWDTKELSDHSENLQRILWLACGDIVEMEGNDDDC